MKKLFIYRVEIVSVDHLQLKKQCFVMICILKFINLGKKKYQLCWLINFF